MLLAKCSEKKIQSLSGSVVRILEFLALAHLVRIGDLLPSIRCYIHLVCATVKGVFLSLADFTHCEIR